MQLIFYIAIFLIGIFCGSFFTLAIHRLPLGQDITHSRSYCPNCNHRLEWIDLFPLFSYIFLKGKCRYCKNPISPKYLCIETLSGLIFVLFAYSLNINFLSIETSKIIYLVVGLIYISTLLIIFGISLKNNTIQKSVLTFGLILVSGYIIYLYMVENINIYRYVIYLLIILLLLVIDTINLKKNKKSNDVISIIILCVYLSMFINEIIFVLTAIFTLLLIAAKLIFIKITNIGSKQKAPDKIYCKNLHIISYLSLSYIAMLIITNFMYY